MMATAERIDALQQGFVKLLGHWGLEPGQIYPMFDRIVAAYSEPHRQYHTLDHVHETLKVAGRLMDLATHPRLLAIAVWYHDIVYDPQRHDNEQRSAQWADDDLATWQFSPEERAHVVTLITATATHIAPAKCPDAELMIDADLAILGSAAWRYQMYAAEVRREYAWVSDADYRAGRAAVLRKFLARPRIYHTARLFETGEQVARDNLQAEINALS